LNAGVQQVPAGQAHRSPGVQGEAAKVQRKAEQIAAPLGCQVMQETVPLVLDEAFHRRGMPLDAFVRFSSTNAARTAGLYPRKGTVAVGSDADLIVFDPNAEQVISASTHHMRVDYSMFEGMKVKGVPKIVLSRGSTIIENGKFVGKPGAGEFIKRENPAKI